MQRSLRDLTGHVRLVEALTAVTGDFRWGQRYETLGPSGASMAGADVSRSADEMGSDSLLLTGKCDHE